MSLALKREMLAAALRGQDQRGYFALADIAGVLRPGPSEQEAAEAWNALVVGQFVIPRAFYRLRDIYGARPHEWFVTERGKALLDAASGDVPPEDREGFLRLLRQDANLDSFVESAVTEVLWAYNAGRPIAAVICLFTAMEHMVKAVNTATTKPKKDQRISEIFDSLRKRMDNQRKQPEVQAFLSTTFTAARTMRNTATHSGGTPDLDKVRNLLCLFLPWYEAAAALRDNPVV